MAPRPTILILLSVCLPAALVAGLPSPLLIEEAVHRANDHYISTHYIGQADWGIGAYQTGNMRAWETFAEPAWLARSLDFGVANGWQVGGPWPISAPYETSGETTHRLHADSHTAAQTYLDLYLLDPTQTVRKTSAESTMDDLLANTYWPDPWGANSFADDDWGWIDAFYMAAPTLARMANIENNEAYRTQLRDMYNYMKLNRDLYDDAEGLWYRDANSKSETSLNGEKVFWSRGNGWVMAGLVRVLEELPAGHADRAEFESMLQSMAAALVPLQGTDGFWRSSLLDPAHYPNPETSGTAFFTYAMAWGIRHGILNTATYQPVVEAAWEGLTTIALQPSGLLGYIQDRGRAPKAAGASESHPYGVGAFLLAGTEVVRLAGGPEPVWPDAGDNETLYDTAAEYEANFQLDAGASMVRSGAVNRVSWWIGDIFLAEGWAPIVVLPRGTHTITVRLEHDSGTTYEASVTKVFSGGGKLGVAAVTASTDDGNDPANTLDGDFDTRWSASGIGQWIRWDLGTVTPVSEVRLAWFRGNERQAYFDLQVSTDGSSWTDVLTSRTSSGTTLDLESFSFTGVDARYVRYVGKGNSSSAWNSLTEAEIHAPGAGIPDDGDSLPDDWEIARLGTTAYAPGDDPFDKGQPVSADYLAGTDPRDPTDRIKTLFNPTGTPGEFTFSFTARAAFGAGYSGLQRRYTLWTSPDLTTDSWTSVPGYESLPGNNLPVEATVSLGSDSAFYRLSYELATP